MRRRHPPAADEFEGGARRLGRVSRLARSAVGDSSSNGYVVASGMGRSAHAAVLEGGLVNVTKPLAQPLRKSPKRVVALTLRTTQLRLSRAPRPAAAIKRPRLLLSSSAANVLALMDVPPNLAVRDFWLQAATSRGPRRTLATVHPPRRPDMDISRSTRRRGAPVGALARISMCRTPRAKFEGSITCLGRTVNVRQMKTVKFTSSTCTPGELMPLLATAAAPRGPSTWPRARTPRNGWPGTLLTRLSRR